MMRQHKIAMVTCLRTADFVSRKDILRQPWGVYFIRRCAGLDTKHIAAPELRLAAYRCILQESFVYCGMREAVALQPQTISEGFGHGAVLHNFIFLRESTSSRTIKGYQLDTVKETVRRHDIDIWRALHGAIADIGIAGGF